MKSNIHKNLSLFAFLAIVISLLVFTGATNAKGASDLTGTWTTDNGGTYYLRQSGNALWWYGENDPVAPNWSNVLMDLSTVLMKSK